MLALPSCEFGFGRRKFTEPRLPFGFQGPGYKTVLRLYGPITAFCPFGLVAGSFDLHAPLSHGGFLVRFDIFFGDECGFDTGGSDGIEKSTGNRFIDS